MSKIKTKELIICIITVAILMLTIVTDVFAADDLQNLLGDANSFENIAGGENEEQDNDISTITNATNNTTNVNTNKNNVTSMPNTGVDYSVVFIIAISGISAIYAYKKIRNYNNF